MATLPAEAEGRSMSARARGSGSHSPSNGLPQGNSNLCCFWTGLRWTEQNGASQAHVPQSGMLYYALNRHFMQMYKDRYSVYFQCHLSYNGFC